MTRSAFDDDGFAYLAERQCRRDRPTISLGAQSAAPRDDRFWQVERSPYHEQSPEERAKGSVFSHTRAPAAPAMGLAATSFNRLSREPPIGEVLEREALTANHMAHL